MPTTEKMRRRLRVGDVVRPSDSFLRSVGMFFKDSPFANRVGTVIEVTNLTDDGLQMVTVEDASEDKPWKSLNTNVTPVLKEHID